MPTLWLADAADTDRLGLALGQALPSGAFLALIGELGAGKSSLARAICRGTGVSGPIPSPTYALAHPYESGRVRVVHADWYRLEAAEDLVQIGWEELTDGAAVLVEWADRFPEAWPADHLVVRLVEKGDGREVTLHGSGPFHTPLADIRG